MKIRTCLGWFLIVLGTGIAGHDFTHQVWELRGTIFSLEGGYIGFLMLFTGLVLLASRHVKWLLRRHG